jgi:hypothetical protein
MTSSIPQYLGRAQDTSTSQALEEIPPTFVGRLFHFVQGPDVFKISSIFENGILSYSKALEKNILIDSHGRGCNQTKYVSLATHDVFYKLDHDLDEILSVDYPSYPQLGPGFILSASNLKIKEMNPPVESLLMRLSYDGMPPFERQVEHVPSKNIIGMVVPKRYANPQANCKLFVVISLTLQTSVNNFKNYLYSTTGESLKTDQIKACLKKITKLKEGSQQYHEDDSLPPSPERSAKKIEQLDKLQLERKKLEKELNIAVTIRIKEIYAKIFHKKPEDTSLLDIVAFHARKGIPIYFTTGEKAAVGLGEDLSQMRDQKCESSDREDKVESFSNLLKKLSTSDTSEAATKLFIHLCREGHTTLVKQMVASFKNFSEKARPEAQSLVTGLFHLIQQEDKVAAAEIARDLSSFIRRSINTLIEKLLEEKSVDFEAIRQLLRIYPSHFFHIKTLREVLQSHHTNSQKPMLQLAMDPSSNPNQLQAALFNWNAENKKWKNDLLGPIKRNLETQTIGEINKESIEAAKAGQTAFVNFVLDEFLPFIDAITSKNLYEICQEHPDDRTFQLLEKKVGRYLDRLSNTGVSITVPYSPPLELRRVPAEPVEFGPSRLFQRQKIKPSSRSSEQPSKARFKTISLEKQTKSKRQQSIMEQLGETLSQSRTGSSNARPVTLENSEAAFSHQQSTPAERRQSNKPLPQEVIRYRNRETQKQNPVRFNWYGVQGKF